MIDNPPDALHEGDLVRIGCNSSGRNMPKTPEECHVSFSGADERRPAVRADYRLARKRAAPAAKYDLSAASNQKFLADNAAKPGVFKTAGRPAISRAESRQRQVAAIRRRHGDRQLQGLADQRQGVRPDQTGQTAEFPAGQLIPGWVEALSLMKEGDSWELVMPSDLGYGPDGAGDDIPPNQTLVFDMTLLKVTPAR